MVWRIANRPLQCAINFDVATPGRSPVFRHGMSVFRVFRIETFNDENLFVLNFNELLVL
jgi:hypothetical protein